MPGPTKKDPSKRQRQNKKPGHLAAVATIESARRGTQSSYPPAPRGLLGPTMQVWRDFWDSEVAQAVDRKAHMPALRRWIRDVDELARVEPLFRAQRMVAGSMGQPVLNPFHTYMVQLRKQLADTEKSFGMTPRAAAEIGRDASQAALSAAELNRQLQGNPDVIDAEADPRLEIEA